jgi:hypothetical protein
MTRARSRSIRALFVGTLLLLVGCGDGERTAGGFERDNGSASSSLEASSWPYFAPAGDYLYEAPDDPSPGADGLWLGRQVTPDVCFADRNPAVSQDWRDVDLDWIADYCELELAKAFAPLLHFWTGLDGAREPCPGGEPAWAVKYFNLSQVVRIAYMPAYYDDCGRPQLGFGAGHAGDSELIMVEAIFNSATQHWEFNQMWLSAHDGELTDRSAWVRPDEARFSLRRLGHPGVWVSYRKHANYKSSETCNKTEYFDDLCVNPFLVGDQVRFPVKPHRNVGSRHRYMMNCTMSEGGRFFMNGVSECFWTGRIVWKWMGWAYLPSKIFGGWHPSNDLFGDPPGPYGDKLMSEHFEKRCGTALYQPGPIYCTVFPDWGPGPNPPGQ